MAIEHSDAARELEHLAETLMIVASETELLEPERVGAEFDMRQKRIESGGAFSDELAVAEILYEHKDQTLRNLRLAKDQPYFTRVDFIPKADSGGYETRPAPNGDNAKRAYYIGKWGVLRAATLDQVVVDWRAPIANLYYSGQIGPMRYEAPDGAVEGTLTLKRQFGIARGELQSIFDTSVAGMDAFLQSVLGETRTDKLREVVSTLQSEQNDVIRAPMERALIVQGAAGSGKTTIALHRIAYLLYAYRQRLLPKNVLILAPSPLFLDYISAVLPELGVEQVEQTTFPRFALSLLEKRAPKMEPEPEDIYLERSAEPRLPRKDEAAPHTRADPEADEFEGSLRYYELLSKYLDDLELRVLPEEDIVFGPVVLYTRAQLQEIFITDLAPFPYARRLEEIIKYINKKLKPALNRVLEWTEEECASRAENLRARMGDGEERQLRMRVLYDSRDKRVEQAKERAKTFLKDVRAKLPTLAPIELYQDFLRHPDNLPITEAECEKFDRIAERALARLAKKRARTVDLAPLCAIESRVRGLPRRDIRHAVIDEAQDFSPFQLRFLRDALGHESFTVVGDMMQSIGARGGVRDWRTARDGAFMGRGDIRNLRVSYRSTIEIMTLANAIAARFPTPEVEPAHPLPRSGEPPKYVFCADANRLYETLAREKDALEAEGYRSIALVERTRERASELSKRLGLPLLNVQESLFTSGACVVSVAHTKGLEFDAVVVCDAGGALYPFDEFDARLLYVCVTRALHRLVICWTGELTGLLKG
ncbi:MAG: UvrD-helicase domain-containing protein [Oscillospiraceae bacterium]|jgi:DNA helicase-2/ATP-dependent DNA helicase PcrA|nr:UvrD-helicase domain-containing protein [Oscillospiraceae bacterium]